MGRVPRQQPRCCSYGAFGAKCVSPSPQPDRTWHLSGSLRRARPAPRPRASVIGPPPSRDTSPASQAPAAPISLACSTRRQFIGEDLRVGEKRGVHRALRLPQCAEFPQSRHTMMHSCTAGRTGSTATARRQRVASEGDAPRAHVTSVRRHDCHEGPKLRVDPRHQAQEAHQAQAQKGAPGAGTAPGSNATSNAERTPKLKSHIKSQKAAQAHTCTARPIVNAMPNAS
jgi:hypothetical protein